MSWQRLHIESVRIHQRPRPTADQPHASTRTAAEMEPRVLFPRSRFLSFSAVFGCPGASIGVQRRSFPGEWGRSWLPEIPLQLPWHGAIFSLQTTWHQLGHGAILDKLLGIRLTPSSEHAICAFSQPTHVTRVSPETSESLLYSLTILSNILFCAHIWFFAILSWVWHLKAEMSVPL